MNSYSNDSSAVIGFLITHSWKINGTAANDYQSTSPATWEQQVIPAGDFLLKKILNKMLWLPPQSSETIYFQHLLQTKCFSCV